MRLGLGLGLGAGAPGGGAVPLDQDLPPDLIGLWAMDQYSSTPRPHVPNMLSVVAPSSNMFCCSRRQLNRFFLKSACTVVDDAVNDPDGSQEASTVTSTAGTWRLTGPTTTSIPAGTYTLGCNARRNTESDQGFCFTYDLGTTKSPIQTATSSWQRFSWTFTTASTQQFTRVGIINTDGVSSAALQICDLEIYPGSSDLGPQVLAGHLYLGRTSLDLLPSFSGNSLDFTGGRTGFIQFPGTVPLQNATMAAIVSKTQAGNSGGTPQSFISRVNGFASLTGTLQVGAGLPGSSRGQALVGGMANLWELNNQGWHVITQRHRTSDNRRDLFIDTVKIGGEVNAPASVECRDLGVSYTNAVTVTADYQIAAIALWNRALSDAEIRA